MRDLKKIAKKGFAQVRDQLAEPGKSTMHMNGTSEDNGMCRVENNGDAKRQTIPSTRHDGSSALKNDAFHHQATSLAGSSKPCPPLPPHAVPSMEVMPISKDGITSAVRPQVTRRPTVPNGVDDPKDNNLKAGEQPKPQLCPIKPEHPLSEVLNVNVDGVQGVPAHDMGVSSSSSKAHGQAIDEPSMRIEEQARKIQALQEENNRIVISLGELNEELQREKERHAGTKQAWRKATVALSANRQDANYKIDDDFLRAQYQNIIFDVAAWVATNCVPTFDNMSDSDRQVFRLLTPRPHKYFHVKRTRELLLQSLVMHVLVDLVLDFNTHFGLWWAGKQSAGLRLVQAEMEPDSPHVIPDLLKSGALQSVQVRDYSLWKAKTALLLSAKMAPPAVENNVNVVFAEMQKTLKPFVHRTNSGAWRELKEIIYKAILFDLELHKSRALFQVHRWSVKNIEDMQFEESNMETADGLQAARNGMKVELILAPLITKTGNADGESFESLSLISRWTVVCYENRKQIQKL